jgi:hypothetical protein
MLPNQIAGANRRWRCTFRCRGPRRESAVAQLFSLIWLTIVKRAISLLSEILHFSVGHTANYSESAAGTP